jgi:beta-glucosidase
LLLSSWRLAADDNSAVSVVEGMKHYAGNQLIFEKDADLTSGANNFVNKHILVTLLRVNVNIC